jgi:transposase
MEEVTTIALDLAKLVFQAHGADGSGGVVFRKTLRRHKVLAFFAALPHCRTAALLYCSTDCRCRAGAPVQNLSQSKSFH